MYLNEKVLKIVFVIGEKLLLPFIISALSIRLYKYWLKDRYKKILIKDNEIYLLESMFITYTLIPLFLSPLIYSILDSFKGIKLIHINIFIFILSILMTITPIYFYLKKRHEGSKFKFVLSFIFPSLITILATWWLTIVGVSILDILKVKDNKEFEDPGYYLVFYIMVYLLFGIAFSYLYSRKRDNLKIFSNRIDVFYMENNEIKTKYSVKFKDLDIDKEFISFYCDTRKKRTMIPKSNLVKIEYHYDKSTLK